MRNRRSLLAGSAGIAALLSLGIVGMAGATAPPLPANFGEQPLHLDSQFALFAEGDPPAGGGGGGAAPTLEELQRQIATLTGERDTAVSERDGHKTKLDEIENNSKTAEQRAEEARKAEIGRLAGETTAEREKREAVEAKLAKRDALDALRDANVIDPDLAYSAIKDAIEIKDGEPVNIAKLVEKFVADRPAMVGKTPPDTRPSNPAGSTGGSGGNDARPSRPAGRI